MGDSWRGLAWRFGPPILWMAIISGFSTDSFSAEHTSRFLLPFLQWLLPGATPATVDVVDTGIRKAAHLTEYGILALLWYRALRRPEVAWQTRVGLIAFVVATAFAGLDELHQMFVPSRGSSIADVGLDSLGAALALTASRVVQHFRGKWPAENRNQPGKELP